MTGGTLQGTVGVSEHLGSDTSVHVELVSGENVMVSSPGDFRVEHGDTVWLTPKDGQMHRFDAQWVACPDWAIGQGAWKDLENWLARLIG